MVIFVVVVVVVVIFAKLAEKNLVGSLDPFQKALR